MENKLRIAVGGIRHETNTFSPIWTEYDDFRIKRGAVAVPEMAATDQVQQDVELLPTFVASAVPNGMVRKAAYERLKDELLRELAATLPVDGVYLDLHGAMEVEEIGDGEGDLVSAVRALVGNDVLISVSLDLHGNISPTLIENANIFTAYRTAPHRDDEETRERALALLVRALRDELRPVPVLLKIPLLLPGEAAITEVEPARSLYAGLDALSQGEGMLDVSLLIGCAWTDSAYTCASVIATAEREGERAQAVAAQLAEAVWARRHEFGFSVATATVDDAIRQALDAPERPVFLSDSGDNITAGGAGDIPFFVERLLALHAQDALVAGLADAEAVQRCAEAGLGSEVDLSLGGKLDTVNGKPLNITARVERVVYEPADQGGQATTALVRVEGTRIILTRERLAFIDRAKMVAAGVDAMQFKIVVVKLGYLFPDLYDHAPLAIMALSAGATDLRLDQLPYRKLPRPIFPLDVNMEWWP